MTRIVEVLLADDPARWRAIDVVADRDGVARVGTVGMRFGVVAPGGTSGIVGWTLFDAPDPVQTAIDGLAVTHATDEPRAGDGLSGYVRIDHLVVTTPDLGRTVGALEIGFGEPCKRIRTLPTGSGASLHQAFFRLGEVIVEVVGPPEPDATRASEPARFAGVVLVARDLDDLCGRLGPDAISAPKAAVQEGRRIATVRAAARLGCPVALMDDRPRH
jgi:hypothetical protein